MGWHLNDSTTSLLPNISFLSQAKWLHPTKMWRTVRIQFLYVTESVSSVSVRECFVCQWDYFLCQWECVFCHLECVLFASESKFSILLRVCSMCQWECILYVSVNVCLLVRVVFYEIVFQFVRMCLIVSEHVFCVLIKVWYIDKRVFFVSVKCVFLHWGFALYVDESVLCMMAILCFVR